MTTAMTLPAKFVLYIPTRSTKKDLFAGYILLNTMLTSDGPAQQLSASQPIPYYETPYILKPAAVNSSTILVLLQNIRINMSHWIPFRYRDQVLQPPGGGEPLIILQLSGGKLTDYLPPYLKRNIPIVSADTKPTITTTVPLPATSPPVLTPAGGAGDSTPLPQQTTTHKKKKASTTVKKSLSSPEGDLSFHVARQLLDLARIRKTECPIIAEELTEGNTAAMPCGHLFSRLAIEESFKTERYRCPACRLSGTPTYI